MSKSQFYWLLSDLWCLGAVAAACTHHWIGLGYCGCCTLLYAGKKMHDEWKERNGAEEAL